jgi:DNA adenine methylase
VKWAGGKPKSVPLLLEWVPRDFGTYHEPFVGGGALFWALAPRKAVLRDANVELTGAYRALRDFPHEVIRHLKEHRYEEAYYYEVRAQDPLSLSTAERAARFLFLNRACFNGLYRVNGQGKFNVPFGRYVNPTICDEENLLACSRRLQGIGVVAGSYNGVEREAEPGDLVYFDPPYIPVSKSASFTRYTADGFTLPMQEELRDVALRLAERGVHVVLSNSNAPETRALYDEDRFEVREVSALRSVNSDGAKRGAVTELMMRPRSVR